MSAEEKARAVRRYAALDIHKHYCVVAGVDREGRVTLQPVRVEHADLEGWLQKNLQESDRGVIESTTNAWHAYDLQSPLAERVVVANPIKVKQIALVRHLLELVWYVLTRRQPYRHFSHERIAYKYLTWAWQMDETARDGLTRQQFARYYLMKMGIGHDLTRVAFNPKHPRRLASEAELLALRPELIQTE